MSTVKELIVRLRPTRKVFVSNQKVTEKGLRAQWHDFNFVSADKEVVDGLDALLNGEQAMYWRKRFYRVPSESHLKKMADAAEAGRKAQEEVLTKTMTSQEKKEASDFDEFMKKFKKQKEAKMPKHGQGVKGSGDVESRKTSI
jgi:hypothetical protein